MSTTQNEAQKTAAAEAAADATRKAAEADAAAAEKAKAAAEAAEAAAKKPAPKKVKDAAIMVAVHRIVYGKNQVAPPASFLRASDLSAADLEFLTASGAVREPNEAEALVAEAALNDPIG